MLLSDKADFKFQTWDALTTSDPVVSNFISIGSSEEGARGHYDNLRQNKPAALASLLNLVTAMKTIHLPSTTPLDYFKEILWDESMAQDRFFGYADKSLVDQVRSAAMEHEFAPELSPGLFHPKCYEQFQRGSVRRGKRPAHLSREGHEKHRGSTVHQGGTGHRLLPGPWRPYHTRGHSQLHHARPDRPQGGVRAPLDCRNALTRSGIRPPIHDRRLTKCALRLGLIFHMLTNFPKGMAIERRS